MGTVEENIGALLNRVSQLEKWKAEIDGKLPTFDNRIGSQLGDLKTKLQEVVGKVQHLDCAMNKIGGHLSDSKGKHDKKDVLSTQEVKSLSTYNGDHKEFHSWYWQLKSRLSSYSDVFRHIMAWIDRADTDLTEGDMEQELFEDLASDELQEYQTGCLKLWSIVCIKTGPKLDTMLQNLEEGCSKNTLKGPRAVYQLKQEALGLTGHRATLLADLVLNPKQTTLELLHGRVEQWDAHVRELKASGAEMPQCALITGLKALLPKDMANQVKSSPEKYTTLEELRIYVKATISLQREHFFAGGVSNQPKKTFSTRDASGDEKMPQAMQTSGSTENDSEHWDETQEDHSHSVIDQDAMGIWRINGACNACGVWGHRRVDCDKYHGKGKAGGKGSSEGKGKDKNGG